MSVVETGRTENFPEENWMDQITGSKNYTGFEGKVIRKTVSVLIPAYNAEKYILETLKSVRFQTFKPLEVIVLDDASTDGTKQVVKCFKKSYRHSLNVRVLGSPRNRGIGGARRELVSFAKGNFVAFLSSDDVWKPSFLDNAMLEVSADCGVYCDYWITDSKLRKLNLFRSREFSKLNVVKWALMKNMFVNFSGCVFPRSFFNRIGFSDLRHGEDLILLLDLVLADLKLKRIGLPLLLYRTHRDQGTNVTDKREFYRQYGLVAKRLLRLGVTLPEIDNCYNSVYSSRYPSLQFRVKRKIKNVLSLFKGDN